MRVSLFLLSLSSLLTNTPIFADEFFVVTASSLIVRQEPDRKSKALASLPYRSAVVLLERSATISEVNGIKALWFRIRSLDIIQHIHPEGYVFSGYLEPIEGSKETLLIDMPAPCSLTPHDAECRADLEDDVISAHPTLFSRTKTGLTIISGKGTIQLNDWTNEESDSIKIHHLFSYDEITKCAVVYVELYEGEGYHLIHLPTATTIVLQEYPLPTPRKDAYIALIDSDGYKLPGLQLVDLSGAAPRLVLNAVGHGWMARSLSWKNPQHAVFERTYAYNGTHISLLSHVVKENGKWKLIY